MPRGYRFATMLVLAAGLAAVMAAGPAVAHGLEARFEGDGHISVVFRDSAGAPMAGAAARVFAPGAAEAPAWTGMADPDGRVTFDAPQDGVWRIDLTAADGHVDRTALRVDHGLPSGSGAALPRWLLAVSLTGNILAFLLVAVPRLRAMAAQRRWPTSPTERRTNR